MTISRPTSPEARPGLFYGYVIVIASFCIFFASFGVRFAYGVFFNPMSAELGWSNATTALAFSISAIIEGIFNIILGGFTDKYGPRKVLTISGFFIGAGYCLMPLVDSFWQFYLFYGVIVGIGMGGVFAPLITVVSRWFKARRSIMCGLVISGNSIGMLVLSPLSTRLIITEGWRNAFLIIGVAVFVIITVAAQFLKRDPAQMGLLPDGKPNDPGQKEPPPVTGLTFKEAFKTRQIWLVFFVFFALGFFFVGNQMFLVPNAIFTGMSNINAAYILSVMGAVNVVGMIGLGAMGDKIGNRRIFIFGFTLAAVASAVIVGSDAAASFFIFAVIAGAANGGMASSMSPLTASLFGLKELGVIFGLCGFGCTLGQAVGPYLVGSLLDLTQNYNIALSVCGIIAIAGLVLALVLKPMKNSVHHSGRL